MPARYAFLGPEGTFAHAAARQLLAGRRAQPGSSAKIDSGPESDSAPELVPYASVTQAIDALHEATVEAAVVPLENSVEGAVPATLDALAGDRPLVILAETMLPV